MICANLGDSKKTICDTRSRKRIICDDNKYINVFSSKSKKHRFFDDNTILWKIKDRKFWYKFSSNKYIVNDEIVYKSKIFLLKNNILYRKLKKPCIIISCVWGNKIDKKHILIWVSKKSIYGKFSNSHEMWFNKEGESHREGGKPSYIDSDGVKMWYKNNQLHREEDKPAYISSTGNKNGI